MKLRYIIGVSVLIVVSAGLIYADSHANRSNVEDPVSTEGILLTDVRSQSVEFMGFFRSINLKPHEETLMEEALSSIPAPCCSDYPASTCCCECNIIRTVWGLSKLLIREHNYSAKAVNAKAKEWLAYVNPQGYAGDACFNGGCNRPFHSDGCGGMNDKNIIF
jgi:hypothetical protein